MQAGQSKCTIISLHDEEHPSTMFVDIHKELVEL
jgi:hypothetical protein